MNGQPLADPTDLSQKIALLVQERGWNQEEFARASGLNRQTVRQILQPTNTRRLRNATVAACARALQLSVHELHALPLERLLARVPGKSSSTDPDRLRHLYDQATQPELLSWIDRNPERATQLSTLEMDELLSLQGTGGPLTGFGVEHFVELLERKRRLLDQIHAIAGTEYLDLLEQFVSLLYEKVQPYPEKMTR